MLCRAAKHAAPWLIVTISIAALISGTPAAYATVIFDNFDAGGGFHPQDNVVAASAFRQFGFVSANRAAAEFTITGGNCSLDAITLPISVQNSIPGNFLRVRLAADAGGAPGATLEVLSENQGVWPTFSNPFTTTTTLSSVTHPLLSNGASYWIVTELTSFPNGDPMDVDYRWFTNTSGIGVPFRQQQQDGGGLPSDPWTGFSGSLSLAFRVDGTRISTTYTWNVPSGSWTAGASWSPTRTTPAADDILVFDGVVTPSATVTAMPNSETIGQLRVTGGAQVTLNASNPDTLVLLGAVGEDLAVDSGSTLALASTVSGRFIVISLPSGSTGRVSGEMTAAGSGHRLLPTDPGSVTFESGSNCRTLTGFIGNVFGNTGANGVVVFRSGSTYHHGAGLHPFGLTQPNSRIVLETGSLVRYLATAGGGAFGGRTYGDCEWNTNPPITIVGGSAIPITIDNFTVISGGFSNTSQPSGTFLFNIKGNLTVTGAGFFEINPGTSTGTVNFNGTGVQTISGNGTIRLNNFSDLVVQNPAGLNLGRDLFTDGTVSLSGGHLITGPYLLHLGQVASVGGSFWVVGNLGRIMPGSAGTVTRSFEIGDALRPAAVIVSFASVQDSGTVIVRTDPGDHSDLAASGLDPGQSVNRVWNFQNLGVAFTTCDVTLNFTSGDLDAGADPTVFRVGKRDGATWSLPTVGIRTTTSTQTTALTSFSDFAVAQQVGVSVSPTVPASTFLAPARPTPFRLGTVLEYSLARAGAVELTIHSVNGQRIRTLERGERGAGVHRVDWDGRDNGGHQVPAAIYYARLSTIEGNFRRTLIKIR